MKSWRINICSVYGGVRTLVVKAETDAEAKEIPVLQQDEYISFCHEATYIDEAAAGL